MKFEEEFLPPKFEPKKRVVSAYMLCLRGQFAVNMFVNYYNAVTAKLADTNDPDNQLVEEQAQDLLRAMIVFASTTLDAVVQCLLRDALEALILHTPEARRSMGDYVAELMERASQPGKVGKAARRLVADAVVGPGRMRPLIESRMGELAPASFQSFDQLCRASEILGIRKSFLTKRKQALTRVLKDRNDIVHRLDIPTEAFGHADAQSTQLTPRNLGDAERDTHVLIGTALSFISSVNNALPNEPKQSKGSFLAQLLQNAEKGDPGTDGT